MVGVDRFGERVQLGMDVVERRALARTHAQTALSSSQSLEHVGHRAKRPRHLLVERAQSKKEHEEGSQNDDHARGERPVWHQQRRNHETERRRAEPEPERGHAPPRIPCRRR
jgi:hypothetical protein